MINEGDSKSKARRLLRLRTRTWRPASATSGTWLNGERANEGAASLMDRVPGRVKLIGRRLLEPRVVFVLGLMAIGTFALTLHFYSQLSREIDARLEGGFFDNSVGIFTSPFEVAVGDRLVKDELIEYLHAAGYQQGPDSGEQPSTGVYSIDGDSVIVRPGREASAQLNLRPVRIKLNSDRVRNLIDPASGREVKSAEIEGELLAAVRGDNRSKKVNITFDEIPENLKKAVLAVEDRRFFSHLGVDWRGIARAFYIDMSEGQLVQGGSTITQQLIKNSITGNQQTLKRDRKSVV